MMLNELQRLGSYCKISATIGTSFRQQLGDTSFATAETSAIQSGLLLLVKILNFEVYKKYQKKKKKKGNSQSLIVYESNQSLNLYLALF